MQTMYQTMNDAELAAAIDVGKAESLPVNYLEGVAEQLDV